MLSGGVRKKTDNAFASTHRILIGHEAIMVSAVNLILNKDKIWNWHFFGDLFKDNDPDVYEDLCKLERIIGYSRHLTYIVVARSDKTFKRLNIIEEYAEESYCSSEKGKQYPRNISN